MLPPTRAVSPVQLTHGRWRGDGAGPAREIGAGCRWRRNRRRQRTNAAVKDGIHESGTLAGRGFAGPNGSARRAAAHRTVSPLRSARDAIRRAEPSPASLRAVPTLHRARRNVRAQGACLRVPTSDPRASDGSVRSIPSRFQHVAPRTNMGVTTQPRSGPSQDLPLRPHRAGRVVAAVCQPRVVRTRLALPTTPRRAPHAQAHHPG